MSLVLEPNKCCACTAHRAMILHGINPVRCNKSFGS